MSTSGKQTTTPRRGGRIAILLQRSTISLHRLLYRVSGGKIGGRMFNNPVLLLTTTGRKTGKQRVTPLLYLPDGDTMVLIASNGGSPTHPAWYLNMRSNPVVEVEIGRRRQRMRAQDASPEERQRLWPLAVSAYAGYADYQRRTEREIPLVILRPAA
jgi:deazaflavin-dependent oxidoreductase (nitroreductase family)